LVRHLHQRAPQMPLLLQENYTDRLRELLKQGDIDCAVVALPFEEPGFAIEPVYDETFVVAAGHAAAGLSPAWMAGLNLAAWTTWAAANLAGAALSGSIGDTRVLGFALPCMFAGLLILQLRTFAALRTPLLVAVFACGFALLGKGLFSGPLIIIAATIAGATLGLALQRWTSARNS